MQKRTLNLLARARVGGAWANTVARGSLFLFLLSQFTSHWNEAAWLAVFLNCAEAEAAAAEAAAERLISMRQ